MTIVHIDKNGPLLSFVEFQMKYKHDFQKQKKQKKGKKKNELEQFCQTVIFTIHALWCTLINS